VASCGLCGDEQVLVEPIAYHPRCERCGARLFTLVATRVEERRVMRTH
jgi:PHP family Zn ribbon phosphoesterase